MVISERTNIDVTLACEDGQQVEAHKVILAFSIPFFQKWLTRNKHNHPLVYMRGLKSEVLLAIVDFLYFGEANVFQENLDSFLAIAEEFRLKGLTGNDESAQADKPTFEAEPNFIKIPTKMEKTAQRQPRSNIEYNAPTEPERAVAVINDSISVELHELDQQIRSMMTTTDDKTTNNQGLVAICNICGKRKPLKSMPSHIEANHITGVSHACDTCGKVSRSRNALSTHKLNNHARCKQQFVTGIELV